MQIAAVIFSALIAVTAQANLESLEEPGSAGGRWGLWVKPSKNSLTDNSLKDEERGFIPRGSNQRNSLLDSVRMPGTNWCGKGWRTDSFNKLGGYSSADRCCREHDMGCDVSIQPGQTKFGLTNVRFHTVMHCNCDDRFYSCLKMSRSSSGNIVGNLFFNIANIPCFVDEDVEVCTETNFWGRCLKKETQRQAVWRKPFPY